MKNQFSLLKDKRFAPLFLTMFGGAFNDNLFKALLVVMIAYGVLNLEGWRPEVLVSAAAGIFILPFVLIAPLGGVLADKFDKAQIMRLLKITEALIVVAAILGLWFEALPFLLLVLFLFGVQSALFSPGKYAMLPQHLKKTELIGANGLLNSGTFVAILLGNILGSLWGVGGAGLVIACNVLMVFALLGLWASYYIPNAPPPDKKALIRKNTLADLYLNFKLAFGQEKGVVIALFGIAWFYFVGGTYLAQFPNFTKQALGVDNVSLSVFMALFTLGIAFGGLLNNTVLKGKVTGRFVPLAALGITIFTADLYGAARAYTPAEGELLDFMRFLGGSFHAWRIVFDLLLVSICGGLFVVPLNALLQDRAEKKVRARIMAASSVLDALFIFAAAAMAMIMFAFGLRVEHLFFVLAFSTGVVAIVLNALKSSL